MQKSYPLGCRRPGACQAPAGPDRFNATGINHPGKELEHHFEIPMTVNHAHLPWHSLKHEKPE